MRVQRQKPIGVKADVAPSLLSCLQHIGAGSKLPAFMVILLLVGFPSPGLAQNETGAEYRLKLAFLYNFAQFVQWPADAFRDPGSPLLICVEGNNPFQGEIGESLRGRTIGARPVELKHLNANEDPCLCHMVFVRAGESTALSKILARPPGSSLLTVGEAKGFAQRGGIINLVKEENRLRFEINTEAAAQTRLKISSKLLSLAKIVNN